MDEPATLRFTILPSGPRLHPREPFPDAWRRAGDRLVADAISELEAAEEPDIGVHEARKNLKRIRALLRLVRFSIPDDAFRAENRRMRDIGRSLAAARDAWVLVETVAGIYDRYDDLIAEGTFAAAERLLLDRHRRAAHLVPGAAAGAVVALAEARGRLARLGPLPHRYEEVGRGLGRVYEDAAAALRAARRSRAAVQLHEWRKEVKYLRHQLELLEPLQRAMIGAQVSELDALGDQLGLDHDLAVLAGVITATPQMGRHDRERWLLLALAHEWRLDLQSQALRLGGGLFAEEPDAFVARIGGYWEAARPSASADA